MYAALDLLGDLETDRFWWWHGAALTASLLTALAALFVFLAARTLVKPVPAFLTALAFGLGSCVWPVTARRCGSIRRAPSVSVSEPGSCAGARTAHALPPGAGRRSAWRYCAVPTTAVVVLCAGLYLLVSCLRNPFAVNL